MSGLLLLDALAEARIEEALAAGAFDDLPGGGRPLELAGARQARVHQDAARGP